METLRGFAFRPDNVDLRSIEAELDRTWRNARRERLKQREQKIWEEFVKENDIVGTVVEDDKYQFLDELPTPLLKNITDGDLEKLKEVIHIEEEPNVPKANMEPQANNEIVVEESLNDIFHIYDEEKDEVPATAVEDGPLNDSLNSPPLTVREKHLEFGDGVEMSLERPSSGTNTVSTCKSSENVTNVIESSIYCGKVKDLRSKINDEILDMISLLDRRDIFSMEKDDIARTIKRSAEFCTRFNRIYMYQLQRQMQDIKRNNSLTLPFAKHTQFQSQMMRVVSLHQSLLQSFQVFRKAVDQTWCVRESVSALGALVGAARAATEHCQGVSQPKDLVAANYLYDDDLLSSCGKLEQFVNEYAVRCEEFLMGYGNIIDIRKPKEQKKMKKKSLLTARKHSNTGSDAESRLSMYSFNTLRLNKKPSGSKGIPSSSTLKSQRKGVMGSASSSHTMKQGDKTVQPSPKSRQRSVNERSKSRRPLMRDPHAGRARAPRARPPDDIRTMVEAVEACASTHIIMESSPPTTRRDNNVNKNKATPRKQKLSPISTTFKQLNLNSAYGGIQSVSIEMNSAKQSPASKARNPKKDSGREEKKRDKDRNKAPLTSKPDSAKSNSAQSDTPDSPEPDSMYRESIKVELKSVPKELKSTKLESFKSGAVKMEVVKHQTQSLISVPTSPGTLDIESHTLETLQQANQLKQSAEDKKVKKSCGSPDRLEVTRLLKQLCSGDSTGGRIERVAGQKNAQLQYVNGSSPRNQPSTPQLLRILEETIQKKEPKCLLKKQKPRDMSKYRLSFNLSDSVTENMFQYRTKYLQHMLTSPMYANSAVGKPWETIGSVSEQIIDELLVSCVKQMELKDIITEMYRQETS